MTAKTKPQKATHIGRFHGPRPQGNARRTRIEKPVYLADSLTFDPVRDATIHLTTESWTGHTAPNGETLVYDIRINRTTGAITCTCEGFQNTLTRRAREANQTPALDTPHLHCCHASKAIACCEEWSYLAPPTPAVIHLGNVTDSALDAEDDFKDWETAIEAEIARRAAVPCCPDCGDELTTLGGALYCLICGTFPKGV